MKKLMFLFALSLFFAPLSIWGQKTAAKAVNERKPITVEVIYDDTMAFRNVVVKTDTSVLFFELIINADRGKPYLENISKTDTNAISRKVGVLEFYVTEYSLKAWADFKKRLSNIEADVVRRADEEKKKQDRIIQRERDKLRILKADKN